MKFNLRKFIGNKEFMKSALAVAIPLMFQQLVTSSVNLIDNMQVGQLGDAALGGVAAVNRYYMIATFGTNGVLAAAAIFIAQYFGAKNMHGYCGAQVSSIYKNRGRVHDSGSIGNNGPFFIT